MPSSTLHGNYLLESWQQFHLADTIIVFSDESSEVQRESTIYPNSHSWYVDFEPKWSDLAPCSLPLAMKRSMFKGQARVGSAWEILKKYIFKYFKNLTEPRNQMESIKGSKVSQGGQWRWPLNWSPNWIRPWSHFPKAVLVSNKGSGWLQAEERVGQWFAAQLIRWTPPVWGREGWLPRQL